jgi:hypothetical protein
MPELKNVLLKPLERNARAAIPHSKNVKISSVFVRRKVHIDLLRSSRIGSKCVVN